MLFNFLRGAWFTLQLVAEILPRALRRRSGKLHINSAREEAYRGEIEESKLGKPIPLLLSILNAVDGSKQDTPKPIAPAAGLRSEPPCWRFLLQFSPRVTPAQPPALLQIDGTRRYRSR